MLGKILCYTGLVQSDGYREDQFPQLHVVLLSRGDGNDITVFEEAGQLLLAVEWAATVDGRHSEGLVKFKFQHQISPYSSLSRLGQDLQVGDVGLQSAELVGVRGCQSVGAWQ